MAFDVKDALEAFDKDKSDWSEIYEAARNDLLFYAGDQWPENEKNNRINLNRPALVINRLPQFVHQVCNDIRMNTPTINPIPVDDKADEETAKVLKGMIKHIEYNSNADVVYDTAAEYAVKCGIGFIRVDHAYETEYGFDQEMIMRPVHNPLACFLDSDSTECDGRDAKRATVLDTLSEEAFEKLYPGFAAVSFGDQAVTRNIGNGNAVTIAEYFCMDEEARKVALMEDGSMADYLGSMDGVRSVRTMKKRKIKRYKLSGQDILEETDFPGIYIPLVPVYGEQVWADGERRIFSLIRQAKDAQRRYNHWASKETELLSQAPIAPWMAAAGQTEDFADDYRNPERATVLRYKTTDAFGNPLSPPQRVQPPVIPPGFVNAMQGAVEDMKATMGIYDASLGRQSNEKSGVAIQARKQEGDVATFHFGDNLRRSVTQVGRILVNAIPKVYDTQRVIRIIGDEEKPEMVGINGKMIEGQERPYNLTGDNAGQYDVRVTTGPSFTTQRQESAEMMGQLITQNPQLMGVFGDLWMKNTDNPAAEAIAERIKKTIPPNLLDEENPDDPEKQQMRQVIQQGMAKMQEMQQAIAQYEAELQNKGKEHEIKMRELDLKDKELANRQGEIGVQAYQAEAANPNAEDVLPATPERMQIREAEKQAEREFFATLTQGLMGQIENLTNAVNKPKAVVRDPQTGNILGVQ